MVSEDPENLPFNNWAAWDWVSVASSKDPQVRVLRAHVC